MMFVFCKMIKYHCTFVFQIKNYNDISDCIILSNFIYSKHNEKSHVVKIAVSIHVYSLCKLDFSTSLIYSIEIYSIKSRNWLP